MSLAGWMAAATIVVGLATLVVVWLRGPSPEQRALEELDKHADRPCHVASAIAKKERKALCGT